MVVVQWVGSFGNNVTDETALVLDQIHSDSDPAGFLARVGALLTPDSTNRRTHSHRAPLSHFLLTSQTE